VWSGYLLCHHRATETRCRSDVGQKGTANAVGQHAYQALEHAKQAEAATGHADIATKLVQEAIRHLQVAYREAGSK
jgi:hypothetical protein